jgi:site-specific DNA-methyltransferase (adenine-specific)
MANMTSPLELALQLIDIEPVYKDDYVALYHADCKTILRSLPPANNRIIISDPPYGIKWVHSDNPRPIMGDDQPFDPAHLKGYRCILFGGQHYYSRLPPGGSWIIWDKRCPHVTQSKSCKVGPCRTNCQGDYENIWTSFHTHRTIFRLMWNGFCKATEKGSKRIHPTQKPVLLMGWLIESFSDASDLIIDPYSGSCSTLIAARILKRQAIGVELDPKNIPAAITRLRTDPF